jgi:HSP20 family protein
MGRKINSAWFRASTRRFGMTELTLWKKQELDKMRKELEQLFRQFRRDFGLPRYLIEPAEAMKLELAESEEALTLTAELPDMHPEDIKISVTEDKLTLSGESRKNSVEKDRNFQKVEKQYRSFSRSVLLPCRIETERVTATYHDQTLKIVLPKCKPKAARGVKVKAE